MFLRLYGTYFVPICTLSSCVKGQIKTTIGACEKNNHRKSFGIFNDLYGYRRKYELVAQCSSRGC